MDFKYKCAIEALNSLQTNQASLEQRRAERYLRPERGLLQTAAGLRHLGLTPAHLDQLQVVHVAGTKGKGSTCALTESLLRHHGYRTGFFSSPHLVAARERIRIDGRPISEEAFASYFWEVYDRLEQAKDDDEPMPMYFMFLTLMSLYVFLREQVDVAIVEVGIGGAYDSTNVIRSPVVCGVTYLDYDHTDILGSRIEQITEQKAGIIKPSAPVFVARQRHAATLPVLADRAARCQSPLYVVPDLDECRGPDGDRPCLGLAGQYQRQNAALALQLARYWRSARGDGAFDPASAPNSESAPLARAQPCQLTPVEARALADCRWPGRCQKVPRGSVAYYLDGAHTADSVQLALRWFQSEAARDADSSGVSPRTVLLFYSTGSRDPASLLRPLAAVAWDEVVFCPSAVYHVQDASSDQANRMVTPDSQLCRVDAHCAAWREMAAPGAAGRPRRLTCISEAVNFIEESAGVPTQVFTVGSLHLVGGLLSIIDPHLSSMLPAPRPRSGAGRPEVRRHLSAPCP
ncbi:folylpolyglutamate synthase, mitochondrial-like [Pollicipes pollicipes]|uniref:folylpolyglutamate synthase, mitochondrial-like n=1 Tax=Pollicipes pollicipes TaxID=41117 RepID=UPI001884F517|nr:folylpolyglutamate synthase, mitochondrial-like [Pollicipes pollicipes]